MLSDLPRSRPPRRDVGHQLGRDAQHPLAAGDQEPLEGAGHVPAVLQRPDALAAQAARPDQQRARTRGRRPGPSSRPAARPSPQRPRRSCASACACPHRARSSTRPPSPRLSGPPADTACWGRCHAPIKSRRTSPTGDERHNKRKSGPPGRQPQRESARRPVGTFSSASDVTDDPNHNSKPQASSRRASGSNYRFSQSEAMVSVRGRDRPLRSSRAAGSFKFSP